MIDIIHFFPDNYLGTPASSHEFMMAGSSVWITALGQPDAFFVMTGAFHTSNNTIDVFEIQYLN